MEKSQRIKGCVFGGAIGDALGWPVEFLSLSAIKRKYGEDGIRTLDKDKQDVAQFTDDTQMTLFTIDGILRYQTEILYAPRPREYQVVQHEAYLRWLYTQQAPPASLTEEILNGWLYHEPSLHQRRAPGSSCLSALQEVWAPGEGEAVNDSKGCGALMRVAPVGLVYESEEAFQKGKISATLTHGHPSGYLSAAALAKIISELIKGESLTYALGVTMERLRKEDGHEEVLLYLKKAYELSTEEIEPKRAIEALGEGWVGEEALAIAIYCALKYENDPREALLAAVNHDGDSDSTGAICGNLIGTWKGFDALPAEWVDAVEGKPILDQVVLDLVQGPSKSEEWMLKYPIQGGSVRSGQR